MPNIDKKAVVLEYVNAFKRGDLDGVCRQFTPNALIYGVLGWGDLEQVRPIWQELMTCFKLKLDVAMLIQEDFMVAARYTERGVFSAPFRGVEPTGKPYEIVAIEWFVFREELIWRRWGARDSASMLRQMGIPLG